MLLMALSGLQINCLSVKMVEFWLSKFRIAEVVVVVRLVWVSWLNSNSNQRTTHFQIECCSSECRISRKIKFNNCLIVYPITVKVEY